jgi:hypothetical protein
MKIIIGCDPGVTGAISILKGSKIPLIYKIPVKKVVVNKKTKNIYDEDAIVVLLEPYIGKDVFFIQELVGSMPGQGSVSTFGFGRSSGLTIGMAKMAKFEVAEVSPQKWKKYFPALTTESILLKKKEIKELRLSGNIIKAQINELKETYKTLKEKEAKKSNRKQRELLKKQGDVLKKDIEKLNRRIKVEGKAAARDHVSMLYPELADNFVNVNSDGLAESLLIALFGKEQYNELV